MSVRLRHGLTAVANPSGRLLGGEITECWPGWSLAEQGQEVPAVLEPVREFIAGVPTPGSDHRENEPPTLPEQNLIKTRVMDADLVGHVRDIEFDWSMATRLKIDEEQAML